jgi:hypothetical protein
MSNDPGYIPISRKIFGHEFWREKRSFSRFEAWLDLIYTARFEDTPKTEFMNSKPVTWNRGQLPGSVRFLMERWHWGSITKVENFLKYLVNTDMIVIEKGQGINIITICKYDTYNVKKEAQRTQEGQQKDSERTAKGQQKDETNKDNKVIREINKSTIPLPGRIPVRKKDFLDEKERKFLEMFNEITKRDFRTLNPKAKRQLKRLLDYEPKFSGKQFEKAITSGFKDSLKWQDPSKFTPEYITREDKFDLYLNAVDSLTASVAASVSGIGNFHAKLAAQKLKD